MGRYNVVDIAKHTFFKLPKIIIFGEKYKNKLLAIDKIAYAILNDRLNVSIKNGWFDSKGDIYFVYSNEGLMETLNVSKSTLLRVKKRLKEVNLLVEELTGRANRLYLIEPEISNEEEAKYILETEEVVLIDKTKMTKEEKERISLAMLNNKNAEKETGFHFETSTEKTDEVSNSNIRSSIMENQKSSSWYPSKNNLVRANKVKKDDDDINIRNQNFINQKIKKRLEHAGIKPLTEVKIQPFEEAMYQLIEEHSKDYKEAEEVILLAIDIYELNNGKSINYFRSLFEDWEQMELYTAPDIQEYIDNHRNPFSNKITSENTEPVPMINWLKDLKGV